MQYSTLFAFLFVFNSLVHAWPFSNPGFATILRTFKSQSDVRTVTQVFATDYQPDFVLGINPGVSKIVTECKMKDLGFEMHGMQTAGLRYVLGYVGLFAPELIGEYSFHVKTNGFLVIEYYDNSRWETNQVKTSSNIIFQGDVDGRFPEPITIRYYQENPKVMPQLLIACVHRKTGRQFDISEMVKPAPKYVKPFQAAQNTMGVTSCLNLGQCTKGLKQTLKNYFSKLKKLLKAKFLSWKNN